MIPIRPEQAHAYRLALRTVPEADAYIDIGYLLVWFGAVDLNVSSLLMQASGMRSLQSFDTLTRGMDFRVKVERLRALLKGTDKLGPNLDARLTYIEKKCLPMRNRIAHSLLTHSESGKNEYHFSGIGSLPWKELGISQAVPDGSYAPVTYGAEEILGWGAWLAAFTMQDLPAVTASVITSGQFEVKAPKTSIPTPVRFKRRNESGKA
jgi:hypothetical protein